MSTDNDQKNSVITYVSTHKIQILHVHAFDTCFYCVSRVRAVQVVAGLYRKTYFIKKANHTVAHIIS